MFNAFVFFATYIIPALLIIPLIFGIIKYKHLTTPLKLVFYLVVIYVVMNGINSIQVAHKAPSKFFNDLLALFDFPLISAFYMLILSKKWKKPVIIIAVIYILFWGADWFIEIKNDMNVYPVILEGILIMLYAIVYMNQQTLANIDRKWSSNSLNWINSGFLIYFASSLLFFTFFDVIVQMHLNNTVLVVLWIINDIALITEFALITIGFNKCRQ